LGDDRRSQASDAHDNGLLRATVSEAIEALRALRSEGEGVLEPADLAELDQAAESARARLRQPAVRVVVVGEKKSGKSTLINAMLGAPILGVGVREHTGTTTEISYADQPDYEAEREDGSVERFSALHPDPRAPLRARDRLLQGEITAAREAARAREDVERQRREVKDRLQSDLLSLMGARSEAEQRLEAARALAERASLDRRLIEGHLSRDRAALPLALTRPSPSFFQRLWARLARHLHRDRLRAIAERAETAALSAEAEARAQAMADDLRHVLRDAEARAEATERRVSAARAAHAEAQAARDALGRSIGALVDERTHLVAAGEQAERAWRATFADRVAALTDLRREGPQVRRLRLRYPGKHLPRELTLVDTPGLNTDDTASAGRAWAAVRELADAALIVSDLRQAVPLSLIDVVARMGVPHVALVLTRADLVDADSDDPAADLEAARRSAIDRFARQLGQEPSRVLAFTTSATRVLAHTPADAPIIQRFDRDLGGLLEHLRVERPVAAAARASQDLRHVLRRLGERCAAAERRLRARAGELESARPEPAAAVSARALSEGRPQLEAAAAQLQQLLDGELRAALSAAEATLCAEVQAATERPALDALRAGLPQRMGAALGAALQAARRQLQLHEDSALQAALDAALHRLEAKRSERAGGTGAGPLLPGGALVARAPTPPLRPFSSEAAPLSPTPRGHGLAVGGAAAGLALGVVLSGGIALPALLAVGAATAATRWFNSVERGQRETTEAIQRGIQEAEPGLRAALIAELPDAAALEARLEGPISAAAQAHAEALGLLLRDAQKEHGRLQGGISAVVRHQERLRLLAEQLDRGLREAAQHSPGVLFLRSMVTAERVELRTRTPSGEPI
jgi:hypothetical protein